MVETAYTGVLIIATAAAGCLGIYAAYRLLKGNG